MEFFLVAMNGSKLGLKVRIHEGFTIGRKNGDLVLDDDPKVSATHAKVTLDNKGQFILVDQGSSNAMVINNRKVKKVALMPGITFRLGSTLFRVIREEAPIGEHIKEFVPPEKTEEDSLPKVPPAKPKTWKEKVIELLEQNERMISNIQEPHVGSFSPAIMLDFVEGIQADTSITLGYGPREAGYGHLDIELKDPTVPGRAFQLSPGPGSVQIRDLSGGSLLVNNRSIEMIFLEEGDMISIGQTKIKVRYL